jgi:hypothetical protein
MQGYFAPDRGAIPEAPNSNIVISYYESDEEAETKEAPTR